MADERPFMPPPPRELRDLPPRPPQPQQSVEDIVPETTPVEETVTQEVENLPNQEEQQEEVVEKKIKERKKINKKPFYWIGFLFSVAAAVGLIILFFLKKQ